jgi:two-component system nitrate/nitrite response regulator NarL
MTRKMVATYVGAIPVDAAPSAPSSIFSSLSVRELEILRGIAQGASNKEIARNLGIAETTVKVHVQNVLRKLRVTTRVHAAVMATEIGLSGG